MYERLVRALACVTWLMSGGCGDELGECNSSAANELVYGRNGLVATKGQAMTHDSCGNGAFCHSRSAHNAERYGAPASLDFDMLPTPSGLRMLRSVADDSWRLVRDGEMPPSGVGKRALADGDWRADLARSVDAPTLPSLSTEKGMAIFRNWLACGAPVVRDTRVPAGLQPVQNTFVMAGAEPTWSEVYSQVLKPYCATAGCHTDASSAGGLSFDSECSANSALQKTGACSKKLVVARDPDSSFLVEKLESATPSCGGAMPPSGPLPGSLSEAVRAWIAAGAEAKTCS